jgi:RNA polymerase sigma-70 factor (ECF subfamily)
MSILPLTRYSLIARLADPADADAWATLTAVYERAIHRYCRSRGLQDADARDVVQQVLITLHRKVADWRPNGRPGAFRAWVLAIAHRSCLRAFRDLARRRRIGGAEGGERLEEIAASAAADAAERSDQEWRRWAFCWAAGIVEREVAATTWQAFWLAGVEDVPAAEVARRLGVRVGSVYTNKCRVLDRIRAVVADLREADA